MRRSIFNITRYFCLLAALFLPMQAQSQRLSAATMGQRPADANPQTQTFAGPVQLFDNLYYMGTTFVSAYLLVTSDGLIMIDSLYNEFTGQALDAIEDLGLDPADIRYVLVTHGHTDHTGGAIAIKERSGAPIAMSAEDWAISGMEADLIYADGDTLTLGDTTIDFYVTPGHTPGVLSMAFTVRDGANTHKAFLFGGHNVTTNSAENFEWLMESVERLQAALTDIEVNLTSHPWAALIFQRAELLANRQPGQPHPFVDGEDFRAFLAERLESSRTGLERARQAE